MHGGLVNSEECERFEIVDPHWLRIAVKEEAIPLFTLSQSFLGALAFSYVARHALHGHGNTLLKDQTSVNLNRHAPTVPCQHFDFVGSQPTAGQFPGEVRANALDMFRSHELDDILAYYLVARVATKLFRGPVC